MTKKWGRDTFEWFPLLTDDEELGKLWRALTCEELEKLYRACHNEKVRRSFATPPLLPNPPLSSGKTR
jgi:hypothetical protein